MGSSPHFLRLDACMILLFMGILFDWVVVRY